LSIRLKVLLIKQELVKCIHSVLVSVSWN